MLQLLVFAPCLFCLHGVIDRKASVDESSSRRDVHGDCLAGRFDFEVHELGDQHPGRLVVHRAVQKHHAFAEQRGVKEGLRSRKGEALSGG